MPPSCARCGGNCLTEPNSASSQGALDDLEKLAGVTDEIVFQTYRGRSTVRNVDAYVARLARLAIPFKLGLVEHGEWSPPPGLRGNPNFRGYDVFLLNRAPGEAARPD